jgi:coniferyl-aldehyde dehydrogenase
MNAPTFSSAELAIPAEFQSCFAAQRAAFLKAPEPTYAERLADLMSLGRLVKDNQAAIVAAINADYGNRSAFETTFGEVFSVLDGVHDATKRLKSWMKPRRRSVDHLTFPGASNRVIPQPLGSSASSSHGIFRFS